MTDLLFWVLATLFMIYWVYFMIIRPFFINVKVNGNIIYINSGFEKRHFDISDATAVFFCRYVKGRSYVKRKFKSRKVVVFIYGWGGYLYKDVIAIVVGNDVYFIDINFKDVILGIPGVNIDKIPDDIDYEEYINWF